MPAARSGAAAGHRYFAVGSYSRNFLKIGATTVSLFFESRTIGTASYLFSTDANNDGSAFNDLIYVPRDQSEMNFEQFATGGVTYTPQMQMDAWDAYINQDPYLSTRRGQYAERNGLWLPLVHRADLSVSQDATWKIGNRDHTFQFRLDIDNFSNMLNSDWGVGQRVVNATPLTNTAVDAQGRLRYRMRVINGQLMTTTFERTAGISDVYRMMFSVKYMF